MGSTYFEYLIEPKNVYAKDGGLKDDYPGLHDYYMRWYYDKPNGISSGSPQHQAMAEHYRDLIEDALREFDGSFSEEVYEALAWQGLKNTVAWENLSDEEKKNIDTVILNFLLNNPACSD